MSIFAEVGLVDEDKLREERRPVRTHGRLQRRMQPAQMLRFQDQNDGSNETQSPEEEESDWESVEDEEDTADVPSATSMLPAQFMTAAKLYRLGLCSLVLALMLPILSTKPMMRIGAMGSMIPANDMPIGRERSMLVGRDAPTDVCKRWSGQSTVVNGTLYLYGFRTTTSQKQTDNTWSMVAGIHAYESKLTLASQ